VDRKADHICKVDICYISGANSSSPWARVAAASFPNAGIHENSFFDGDRMKSLFKFASAFLFLMSAPLLHADSVSFTLTAPDHVFSYSLPSQPTPDRSGEDFENLPFSLLTTLPLQSTVFRRIRDSGNG
jgi:hypothetical protein